MPCNPEDTKSGKLAIKFSAGDTGKRPIEPCTDYWVSPNIRLDHAGDMTVDEATARVGHPNTVMVRVSNISNQAIEDVNVQAWVCDYTVGVSPSSGLASAGGSTPMTGFANSIAANGTAVIALSPVWTPVPADAALNGGRVCLAANCFADTPVDGQALPPSGFKFCCDSHHGQRNIAVREIEGRRMEFRFFAANADQEQPLDAVLEVREVRGKAAFGQNERQLVRSGPLAELPLYRSRFRIVRMALRGEGFEPGPKTRVRLKPGERREVALQAEFNPREAKGNFHTLDVALSRGDEDVGGVRILAIVTA